MKQINLEVGNATHGVSPLLYGLFLEDINFSCDGGLNTNMVNNHSFDGIYMEQSYTQMDAFKEKRAPKMTPDRLRFWNVEGGELISKEQDGASRTNPWYAHVIANGNMKMENKGYNGQQLHIDEAAISITESHEYEASAYLRNIDFVGIVSVYVKDEQGAPLTEPAVFDPQKSWTHEKALVKGIATGRGTLVIQWEGFGSADIDCVVFRDTDDWGKGDPKWTGGHLRRDLVETLQELHPRFLRFPGGCIVEGICPGNHYQWKHTVGPLVDRVPEVNLWAANFESKGYSQSYQIGFYEYFLLCEDLDMEPLPIVWAGLNCQGRSTEFIDKDSDSFQKDVIENAMDLIEYAIGDPSESHWAKLRAEAGHPKPFRLNMIGIGNENFGHQYHENFEAVKKIVQKKYPNIRCVMSSGFFPEGKDFEDTWTIAKEKFPDVLIDEHFYNPNEWVYGQSTRYDDYPRDTAKVFLGEYAANDMRNPHKANTFGSALAEAAFLTGLERNSDVVELSSYAPLFAMSDGMQWGHNMIWFNPEHVMKTANYYLQEMFGAHIGTEIYSILGELPEKIYAVISGDASKFYLKLVNADSEAKDIKIAFTDHSIKDGTHIKLHSNDLESANELDFHHEPSYHIAPTEETVVCHNNELIDTLEATSIHVYELNKY